MNSSQTITFPRPVVRMILKDFLNKPGHGKYSTSRLNNLCQAFVSGLMKLSVPGELLILLPADVSLGCKEAPQISKSFESKQLYVGSFSGHQQFRFVPVIQDLLPLQHPLNNNLILIALYPPLCAMMLAESDIKNPLSVAESKEWDCLINTESKVIVKALESLIPAFEILEQGAEIQNWLTARSTHLIEEPETYQSANLFNILLNSFNDTHNQFFQAQITEYQHKNLILEVQSAVGWELENEGLFAAVANVVQKHYSYDFLEFLIVKSEARHWKVENVFKRNETEHGGDLLTLILKPDKFQSILESRETVLINTQARAQEYLANPRLMPFMSLKAGVIIPLVHEGQAQGLLKVFSSDNGKFSAADCDRLTDAGAIIAKSIVNISTYADLRRMATIDSLTNVFSRRFFTDHLNREYKRARRYRSSLSLIMIDIDYFKDYNDSNGHLAGDKVLAQVAKILKENVRGADLVARYGGEEFAVILPETGLTNCKIVADKVRSAVETARFKNQTVQPNGNLTISLGIATLAPAVSSANALINLADIALYEAKNNGRNRVEIANEF